MRAALAQTGWLPIFASTFNVRPWEVDRLSWAEVEELQDAWNRR